MAMMDVRVMRMRMPERLVAVRMHMRLGAVPLKIMLVPVMRIMAVSVRMRHGFMRVLMFVRFGQVQPDAGAHQRGGDPEDGTRMFAPTKGAAEKYAPVRAVPRCRRARTNITKLRP